MKTCLYGVKDELKGYLTINSQNSDAIAIREFEMLVNTKDSLISQNVKDFSLWKLGLFDSETGIIEPKLELVVDASSLKRKEN